MQTNNTPDFDRPMLRMGSVAFLAGIVIFMVSTIGFHTGTMDPMDNLAVFAAYAQSDPWIAAHIGQFAGIMLIYAGGFIALHRLLVHTESGVASALAWFGLALAIITASAYTILQAVDGIAQKISTSTWYAIPPENSEEKEITFRVAEGIRWIEIGINSYNRILQGVVAIIFGVAIVKSALLSRWIGAIGIFAGAATVIAGVGVAFVGFAPLPIVGDVSTLISFAWIAILGIFMWRKTREKKPISR